jgi:hypothetical protein
MNDFLLNVCHVGEKGEQLITTCPFLNRYGTIGYRCEKLTLKNELIQKSNSDLKGVPCEGKDFDINLEHL